MIHFSQTELDYFLSEDLPYHDETSHVLGLQRYQGELCFSAKQTGFILCGSEEVARMAQMLDLTVTQHTASGTWVLAQQNFLRIQGNAAALHQLWKVAVTLMEGASGVATRTYQMQQAAQSVNSKAKIATTRKAPVGTRKLMLKAVLAGGGIVHRAGLSETLLVFKQHRVFLAEQSLKQMFQRLRESSPEKKIMIEADSLVEALSYAAAGADVIQLEKMSLDTLKLAVLQLRKAFPLLVVNATGGINLENVKDYADCGVDLLITSHPYYAPPVDVKASMEAS